MGIGPARVGNADRQPFGYTGYQIDAMSGLYYAQARYYDADAGRFISEDILKGNVDLPKSLNAYTYCWNRPLTLVDKDGCSPRYYTPWQEAEPYYRGWDIDPNAQPSDFARAVVDNITIEVEYGVGIGGAVQVAGFEPSLRIVGNEVRSFSRNGTEVTRGAEASGGIQAPGGLGVGGGWQNRMDMTLPPGTDPMLGHEYFAGFLLPGNTDLAWTNIQSSGDIELSFGGSTYFGLGGGGAIIFNLSGFWRQLFGYKNMCFN